MIIRFLLKTDIEIRLLSVSVSDEEDEPLYHIPNEKGKIKQLLLLHSMYPFVIVLGSIQGPNRKDKPKQTYRQIGFPHRMPLNQNYLLSFGHTDKRYYFSIVCKAVVAASSNGWGDTSLPMAWRIQCCGVRRPAG